MADIHPPDHPTASPPMVGRRLFLAGTTGAALLATQRIPGAWATPGAWPDDPFTLGVASGDPTPTGVVLWTRAWTAPWSAGTCSPSRW